MDIINQACRTCLRMSTGDFHFNSLDTLDHPADTINLRGKLSACVPEMNLDSCSSLICVSCTTALRSAYEFKKMCMDTETKIQLYLSSQRTESSVDRIEIVKTESIISPRHFSDLQGEDLKFEENDLDMLDDELELLTDLGAALEENDNGIQEVEVVFEDSEESCSANEKCILKPLLKEIQSNLENNEENNSRNLDKDGSGCRDNNNVHSPSPPLPPSPPSSSNIKEIIQKSCKSIEFLSERGITPEELECYVVVEKLKENNEIYGCDKIANDNFPSKGRKFFPCEICHKKSFSLRSKELHLKTHFTKLFSCKACNKSFSNRIQLQAHKYQSHFLITPIKCSLCGRTFSKSIHFANHKRYHTNRQCKSCGKYFGTPNLLQLHRTTEHFKNHQNGKANIGNSCEPINNTELNKNVSDHITVSEDVFEKAIQNFAVGSSSDKVMTSPEKDDVPPQLEKCCSTGNCNCPHEFFNSESLAKQFHSLKGLETDKGSSNLNNNLKRHNIISAHQQQSHNENMSPDCRKVNLCQKDLLLHNSEKRSVLVHQKKPQSENVSSDVSESDFSQSTVFLHTKRILPKRKAKQIQRKRKIKRKRRKPSNNGSKCCISKVKTVQHNKNELENARELFQMFLEHNYCKRTKTRKKKAAVSTSTISNANKTTNNITVPSSVPSTRKKKAAVSTSTISNANKTTNNITVPSSVPSASPAVTFNSTFIPNILTNVSNSVTSPFTNSTSLTTTSFACAETSDIIFTCSDSTSTISNANKTTNNITVPPSVPSASPAVTFNSTFIPNILTNVSSSVASPFTNSTSLTTTSFACAETFDTIFTCSDSTSVPTITSFTTNNFATSTTTSTTTKPIFLVNPNFTSHKPSIFTVTTSNEYSSKKEATNLKSSTNLSDKWYLSLNDMLKDTGSLSKGSSTHLVPTLTNMLGHETHNIGSDVVHLRKSTGSGNITSTSAPPFENASPVQWKSILKDRKEIRKKNKGIQLYLFEIEPKTNINLSEEQECNTPASNQDMSTFTTLDSMVDGNSWLFTPDTSQVVQNITGYILPREAGNLETINILEDIPSTSGSDTFYKLVVEDSVKQPNKPNYQIYNSKIQNKIAYASDKIKTHFPLMSNQGASVKGCTLGNTKNNICNSEQISNILNNKLEENDLALSSQKVSFRKHSEYDTLTKMSKQLIYNDNNMSLNASNCNSINQEETSSESNTSCLIHTESSFVTDYGCNSTESSELTKRTSNYVQEPSCFSEQLKESIFLESSSLKASQNKEETDFNFFSVRSVIHGRDSNIVDSTFPPLLEDKHLDKTEDVSSAKNNLLKNKTECLSEVEKTKHFTSDDVNIDTSSRQNVKQQENVNRSLNIEEQVDIETYSAEQQAFIKKPEINDEKCLDKKLEKVQIEHVKEMKEVISSGGTTIDENLRDVEVKNDSSNSNNTSGLRKEEVRSILSDVMTTVTFDCNSEWQQNYKEIKEGNCININSEPELEIHNSLEEKEKSILVQATDSSEATKICDGKEKYWNWSKQEIHENKGKLYNQVKCNQSEEKFETKEKTVGSFSPYQNLKDLKTDIETGTSVSKVSFHAIKKVGRKRKCKATAKNISEKSQQNSTNSKTINTPKVSIDRKCKSCGNYFKNKLMKDLHICQINFGSNFKQKGNSPKRKIHTKCRRCGKYFKNKSMKDLHACQVDFSSNLEQKGVMTEIVEQQTRWVCKFCKNWFSRERLLGLHIKNDHHALNIMADKKTCGRKLSCFICKKNFNKELLIFEHFYSHIIFKKHRCKKGKCTSENICKKYEDIIAVVDDKLSKRNGGKVFSTYMKNNVFNRFVKLCILRNVCLVKCKVCRRLVKFSMNDYDLRDIHLKWMFLNKLKNKRHVKNGKQSKSKKEKHSKRSSTLPFSKLNKAKKCRMLHNNASTLEEEKGPLNTGNIFANSLDDKTEGTGTQNLDKLSRVSLIKNKAIRKTQCGSKVKRAKKTKKHSIILEGSKSKRIKYKKQKHKREIQYQNCKKKASTNQGCFAQWTHIKKKYRNQIPHINKNASKLIPIFSETKKKHYPTNSQDSSSSQHEDMFVKKRRCKYCLIEFETKDSFKKHKKTQLHQENVRLLSRPDEEIEADLFKSAEEPKTLEDAKKALEIIINKIKMIKKHRCIFCGESFISKNLLEMHKKIHEYEFRE